MSYASSYIIAARRTTLGRVGGLHARRRVEELAAPVIEAVLDDARLSPDQIDELVVGNATEGGNPARLMALAAGLPSTVSAITLDRQCASGLDAILSAARAVSDGDAAVAIAGGAESLSTAPWRMAKPRRLHQMPHFIGVETAPDDQESAGQTFEAVEALSRELGISRAQQDAWAYKSHQKAAAAAEARRLSGEIVALRKSAEEFRDEAVLHDPELDDLSDLAPYFDPDGTLTPGNTSALNDGAAFVAIVNEAVYEALSRPPALKIMASAACGVAPSQTADAPVHVVKKLYDRLNGFNPKDIGTFEISESSAAQAIAFASQLGVDDGRMNLDGGALVRGHPFGAAGAVLVVRLFTQLVRRRQAGDDDAAQGSMASRTGLAALGARGGLALAALFESVNA